jgi:hypothetical protein
LGWALRGWVGAGRLEAMADDVFEVVRLGSWFEVRKNGVSVRAFLQRESAEKYAADPAIRAWCESGESGGREVGIVLN